MVPLSLAATIRTPLYDIATLQTPVARAGIVVHVDPVFELMYTLETPPASKIAPFDDAAKDV
jgi:hypothetical protein